MSDLEDALLTIAAIIIALLLFYPLWSYFQ